ncbi:hypothetical protein ACFSC2_05890 [Flavobacterium artemisiae]|uniref:Lipocalin-like domain-containing protein n=2 Tax=Flavobacterium artemisiae TaxID=2126556 RepID=A0ABW4HAZ9_9FLAO
MKIIALLFFLGVCVIFIVQDSNRINLEGSWKSTKIILDGKDILGDNILNNFDLANQTIISNWGNSMSISTSDSDLDAHFKIKKKSKNVYSITLSSKEKSLNGDFVMKIDTVHTGPQSYIVYVELKRNKTFINFEKEVVVPPWKPERPKRGQV